ncbi:putative hydrolase of the HAD superfamily [Fibrobacter sp. UWR4]|uniref:HAD-IA family hydrolase n=1 Tax=Fibrobacter sp. UWR4 TaxID=1896218 RepID=UPI000D6CC870|nr:HAD-IA family hydrolase [Fibrobacter sp. UWR4]PWJ71642.1 putative hydrolase of the HAD superfamily [Fibrobacter sp. UWR4]
MKFTNYIFDLGGVILDINMQNALDGFKNLGVPEEELRFDEGPTAKIMQEYQLGRLTTEDFCDAIIARSIASTKPTRQQIVDSWNSICLNIPQRKIDALRVLKTQANVFLLSNTNELHWKYCLDHWFNVGKGVYGPNNLNDCFHHVFLSQEMHLEKPDPEIFIRTFQKIFTLTTSDLPNAENTVFLDDNKANIYAAASCGISTIHVTPEYNWVTNLI